MANSPYGVVLHSQWKAGRAMILAATIAAFAVPVISVASNDRTMPLAFIHAMQRWSPVYAMLAAAIGLGLALQAWGLDQRTRHVYALTLPVPRWRYVLLRFMAGATLSLPAVVALLAGGIVAAASGVVPEVLHAYPGALALRFAFAVLVAFAVFFAIAASTQRTAGIILGVLAVLALAQFTMQVVGVGPDILRNTADLVLGRLGLFSVFGGRWMLVDV